MYAMSGTRKIFHVINLIFYAMRKYNTNLFRTTVLTGTTYAYTLPDKVYNFKPVRGFLTKHIERQLITDFGVFEINYEILRIIMYRECIIKATISREINALYYLLLLRFYYACYILKKCNIHDLIFSVFVCIFSQSTSYLFAHILCSHGKIAFRYY